MNPLTKIMNNTLHTPAPWQVSPYGNITSKSLVIAKVEQMPGNYESEKQANARLIASAPDLLSALDLLLNKINAHGLENKHMIPAIEKAELAIANAKGVI
jgi:hypothetical protein